MTKPLHTSRFLRCDSACLPKRLAVCLCLLSLFALGLPGCRTTKAHKLVSLPAQHALRTGQLVVHSEFELPRDHPLIQDLELLGKQVKETLRLPTQRDPVVVYLFPNELTYRQYMSTIYPDLPPRRAYFVGTSSELAVYSFWGERVQEDLRHEYTHGLLHASLADVPLWIDEGLAEYFEVAGPKPGTVNSNYANQLSASLANGWRPNLERLEQLEEFSSMQKIDYQESWAWVHFLLHSTPEAQQVLLDYLRDLRTDSTPASLRSRLENDFANIDTRFLNYLATLHSSGTWVGGL